MIQKCLIITVFVGYAIVILYVNIVGTGGGQWYENIEHGWPMVYMQRNGMYVPSEPPLFTNDIDAIGSSRWPINGVVLEFSAWRLAANLTIAIGGGILIVIALGSSKEGH